MLAARKHFSRLLKRVNKTQQSITTPTAHQGAAGGSTGTHTHAPAIPDAAEVETTVAAPSSSMAGAGLTTAAEQRQVGSEEQPSGVVALPESTTSNASNGSTTDDGEAPAAKAYKKKEEDEHLRRTLIAALRARDIYVPRRTSLMSVLSLAASVHPLSSSSDTDRAIAALIRHHLWRLRMDRARRLSTTTSPSSTIDPAVLTDRVESLQDQLFALRRRFGAAIDKCASYQKLVDALQAQFDLTPEKGAPPEWRWRTGFRLGSLKQAVLDQQGKERGLSRRMTAVERSLREAKAAQRRATRLARFRSAASIGLSLSLSLSAATTNTSGSTESESSGSNTSSSSSSSSSFPAAASPPTTELEGSGSGSFNTTAGTHPSSSSFPAAASATSTSSSCAASNSESEGNGRCGSGNTTDAALSSSSSSSSLSSTAAASEKEHTAPLPDTEGPPTGAGSVVGGAEEERQQQPDEHSRCSDVSEVTLEGLEEEEPAAPTPLVVSIHAPAGPGQLACVKVRRASPPPRPTILGRLMDGLRALIPKRRPKKAPKPSRGMPVCPLPLDQPPPAAAMRAAEVLVQQQWQEEQRREQQEQEEKERKAAAVMGWAEEEGQRLLAYCVTRRGATPGNLTGEDAVQERRFYRQKDKQVKPEVFEKELCRLLNTDNLTVLGEGGYGRVVKVGKKEGFSREMAVKVVPLYAHKKASKRDKELVQNGCFAASVLNEVFLTVKVNRLLPELAPELRGVIATHGHALLFLDLAKAGSMDPLCGQLSEPECAYVVRRVLWAIEALRRIGVHHGDLKPGNLLLDDHGRILVGDWNSSEVLDKHGQARNFAGTPFYMAPEVEYCQGQHYGTAADVFSLGRLVAALADTRPGSVRWTEAGKNACTRMEASKAEWRLGWEDGLDGDRTLWDWLKEHGYGDRSWGVEPLPPNSFVLKAAAQQRALA